MFHKYFLGAFNEGDYDAYFILNWFKDVGFDIAILYYEAYLYCTV
jgi:hypothetical protein